MMGNQFHSFRIENKSEEMFCRPVLFLAGQKRIIKGLTTAMATRLTIAALASLVVACDGASQSNQSEDGGQPIIDKAELSSPDAIASEKITNELHAAEEALYLDRYDRMLKAFQPGGSISAIYDTRGEITGAQSQKKLEASQEFFLDEAARKSAIAYAAERNSAALLILKDGALILEEYFGDTNQASALNSKSLAKPLGVVAVGRAIAEGHIQSLDQKASDFLTEWKGTPKEDITIRHLLGMRSGLHHQDFEPTPTHIMNRAYLHPRHEDILINEYPLLHKPGSRYDYSNANAEIIAPIIERATGQTYSNWVSQEIVQKLDAAGGEVWLNRDGGIAHAGCCTLLPAQTFAKIGQLVLMDGAWEEEQLLPIGFVAQMRSPSAQNPYAGLGLFVGHPYTELRGVRNVDREVAPTFHSAPYADEDLFLFDGNSNQVVYMVPSKNLLILRVGNTPPKELAWDNAYLPNLVSGAISKQ